LLVLFQPHRYSRTQHLWDEFCRAFNQADILVLLDIYAASEAPIPGVTSEAWRPPFAPPATRTFTISAPCRKASSTAEAGAPGDAILTIGAGNISRASSEFMVCGKENPTSHAHQ